MNPSMKNFINDPIFVWLLGATFLFTALMIAVAFRLPDHVPLFTVLQGLTTGFSGAVLGRVKPQTKEEEKPGPVREREQTITTIESGPGTK